MRFLPWDDEIAARQIGITTGKEVVELQDLHPGKRSDPLQVKSGDVAPQLVAIDRKTPEGKPVMVPLKIKPGIKAPLVLIIPDPKHPTGLRPFVIEDDTANFPWGSVRVLNATGVELLILHEKITKALPNSWNPVNIDQKGKARNVGVQIAARANPKKILYSGVWEHDPQVRKLAFLLPGTDGRTGEIATKIIPQDKRFVNPEKVSANTGN